MIYDHMAKISVQEEFTCSSFPLCRTATNNFSHSPGLIEADFGSYSPPFFVHNILNAEVGYFFSQNVDVIVCIIYFQTYFFYI